MNPPIFPVPQKSVFSGKKCDCSSSRWIQLPEGASFPLKNRVMEMAKELSGRFVSPVRVSAGFPAGAAMLAVLKRKKGLGREGYKLTVGASADVPILLEAAEDAGFFYGMQSAVQLLGDPSAVPCCVITDKPSMEERGYMLDVSRDKVPTMETVKEIVRSLARLRYNSLQLYTEHTFAFASHERVWDTYTPFTSEEIMELDEFCCGHFVELVPNLNSFGHLEKWLKFKPYQHLAECDPPYHDKTYNVFRQAVLHPGEASLEFLDSLYKEFLPNFTSRKLNVGCDETTELGKGRSAERCEKEGVTEVYLDFLSKVAKKAASHGFSVEFWGDIILHKTELVPKLPKGITALTWGYEANHPFDKQTEVFRKAGVDFLVCPGTSSWQTILGRYTNMVGCIRNAMYYGYKNHARGLLMTDWGDFGHWQYYPISFPGIAMGGGASWNATAKETESLLPYGIAFGFAPGKEGVRLGEFLIEMGRVNDDLTVPFGNGTLFGNILATYHKKGAKSILSMVKRSELNKARKHVLALQSALVKAPFGSFPLIQKELVNAVDMALCSMDFLIGCTGGKWDAVRFRDDMLHVIASHEELWLSRNRSGGLYDSSFMLRRALDFDPADWKKR